MPIRGPKRSSKGWSCCRCPNINPGNHHVCDGILPFQDFSDRSCSHWRCPSCTTFVGNHRQAPPSVRHSSSLYDLSALPPPSSHLPYSRDPVSHYFATHHQIHPHSFSMHNAAADFPPYPTAPPTSTTPHPTSFPPLSPPRPTPPPGFSYTKAYLEHAAASQPNSITFAEAFPPPAPTTPAGLSSPQRALAQLRLDYSAGGSDWHGHSAGDEEEDCCDEQDDDDDVSDGGDGGYYQQHQHHNLQHQQQQQQQQHRYEQQHHRHQQQQPHHYHHQQQQHQNNNRVIGGFGGRSDEKAQENRSRHHKMKAAAKPTERCYSSWSSVVEDESKHESDKEMRRDIKGKGKEREVVSARYPVGYQPVSVEDAPDDYEGEEWMEEEW